MKIGIITRRTEPKWGGDLAALYSIAEGLKLLGEDVALGKTAEELNDADFIFLTNTSYDLKEDFDCIQKRKKRMGIIAFHSDRERYYSPCYGFANFVGLCLESPLYSVEQLIENPDILQFLSYSPAPFFNDNYPLLQKAEVCIATSHTEAETMQRDSPGCPSKVVYLDSGISDHEVWEKNNAFTKWTGLKEGEYVLQVGRIELRKNQLGTILAMKDLDIPLVFIATETFYPDYEKMCFRAIQKYRRAPTYVISQNHPAKKEGSLHILPMPDGEKLPRSFLLSAYHNAGLHVHPAFCELPGLTYLEAAKLGVPTIASSWATVQDYFTETPLDDRIVYTLPHHIADLTALIELHFGKKINKTLKHPMFARTKTDVARDLLLRIPHV